MGRGVLRRLLLLLLLWVWLIQPKVVIPVLLGRAVEIKVKNGRAITRGSGSSSCSVGRLLVGSGCRRRRICRLVSGGSGHRRGFICNRRRIQRTVYWRRWRCPVHHLRKRESCQRRLQTVTFAVLLLLLLLLLLARVTVRLWWNAHALHFKHGRGGGRYRQGMTFRVRVH